MFARQFWFGPVRFVDVYELLSLARNNLNFWLK